MSLFRTATRVAVASSVHGRVQQRQRQRWAAQGAQHVPAAPQAPAAQPAPASPAAPGPAPTPGTANLDAALAQLAQLGELRDAGILTPAEFDAKKALILGQST